MAEQKDQKITIEEAFEKLNQTIEELESDNVTLEQSFTLYKQGVELIQECEKQIDTVEKKVALLSGNGELSEFS